MSSNLQKCFYWINDVLFGIWRLCHLFQQKTFTLYWIMDVLNIVNFSQRWPGTRVRSLSESEVCGHIRVRSRVRFRSSLLFGSKFDHTDDLFQSLYFTRFFRRKTFFGIEIQLYWRVQDKLITTIVKPFDWISQ